ncbi:hypothetical protein BDQ17DRAFT_1366074 [Cyathus striatus]|nr:hypothetical protein BDQ17DRAFT_1366074 [Cyathus striatus]
MAQNITLSEELIQNSFHSYLKSSLAQAKAERLLDADVLSSAEGDLMITGPALCLYFAALRSTTSPPSVPLPRQTKSSAPLDLSLSNCPPQFTSFLRVWSHTVPHIQSLAPEHQHDLARIICGLEPASSSTPREVNGIAADLRAVAIEISQRRSFQERYGDDLQAALDAGGGAEVGKRTASFAPPPTYESTVSSPASTPRQSFDFDIPPPPISPGRAKITPLPPIPMPSPYSPPSHPAPPSTPPTSSRAPKARKSPSLLSPSTPAIELIRETLYASLYDILYARPSLKALLVSDPARAYFACVAFAVLQVAQTQVRSDGSVLGVLGKVLTLQECPPHLKPFMLELAAIGREAQQMQDEDTVLAIEHATRGEDIPPLTRMERVGKILEEGVGHDVSSRASAYGESRADGGDGVQRARTRSVEGRAVMFANRINALSLGLTRLRAFKARQGEVFAVLSGVS